MKQVLLLTLFSTTLILVACGDEENTANEQTPIAPVETETIDTEESFDSSDDDLTQAEWMEQNGPEFDPATYEDGTLTTEQGIFEFKESGYTESYEENPVVIVRFDYTNTTDENQNIEFLIWDYFDGKQIFENTTESTRPLMMDEEDNYFDEYHNTQVEVNPNSTVPGAYGFVLKDDSAPLTLDFINEIGETIGTKEISLQ